MATEHRRRTKQEGRTFKAFASPQHLLRGSVEQAWQVSQSASQAKPSRTDGQESDLNVLRHDVVNLGQIAVELLHVRRRTRV